MASLRNKLGIVAAACAATTLLAGAALAGNPNASQSGNGKSPAKGGTPPGQAKKGTTGHGNGHAKGKAKQSGRPVNGSWPRVTREAKAPRTPLAGRRAAGLVVAVAPRTPAAFSGEALWVTIGGAFGG